MLGLLAALTIWLGVVLLASRWTALEHPLRRHAPKLALVGLGAALLVPPTWIVLRFVFACLTALALGRTLDLAWRAHRLGYGERLWFYVALFDIRARERRLPGLDARELAWCLGHALLLVLGWLGVFTWADAGTSQLVGASHWLARWSCGALLCYGLVETIHSSLLIAYRGLGIVVPRINDRPILSTTLVEFWGRRWNREVGAWLRDYAFLPLARRNRAMLGIAAAFLASALLHLWVAALPLGWIGGVTMASFFVVQALALVLERKLGVRRWAPLRRRAWTITVVLASSPLFVEPMLQILAPLAASLGG